MADNFVQIRIKASDTAKPELDSLRADLDELGTKVDTAKIDVDDEDAKRKLLEINAELAALNKRVASPKIDTASAARAESRIEKLKGDVDDLVKKVDSSNASSGGKGLLAKLMFGSEGIEGAGGGGGSFLGIGGGGGGMLAGLAVLVPAIEAAAVEAAGLVSGIAAAGTGAGAFALLAVPAFDKVKGALKDTHAQLAKLSPDERGAVDGIKGLEASLRKMSKAFEPQAFKVFNDGLKIARNLLPAVKPFADTFANSLDGLLKQVGKFTESKGFQDWLKQFHKLEGPSVKAIGEGIGHVAVQIGKLLTTMSKKDVVHAINIAFDILVDTIKTVIYIVSHLMKSWDELSSAFRRVRHDIATAGHDIAATFDRLRHDAADLAHNVAAHFDEIRHDVANLAHNIREYFDEARANIHRWAADVGRDVSRVVTWFKNLPGKIMSALSSLGSKLYNAGKHIISMLASGIRSAIGDVTGAIGSVVSEITSHLPFSPAKKGPLSGRGDPVLSGKRIAQYLAQGLASGSPEVAAAAERVTRTLVFDHVRAAGAGHGGMQLVVSPSGSGLDALFITWLRRAIRTRGGLQKALGP